ncbi:hypothetical protein M404DRAFT_998981 [Pisolithus tinctorius Marx 270]|uniref:Uncharacterized protein n=1 Tax=Pisolithus tinctorius Marx 270 TaxID=870435 RepID=A0A0C3JBB5_PISTI|nr:hypothetical protein M404DRAFT_998981 [Pisolithus tinctorius Marx 270]
MRLPVCVQNRGKTSSPPNLLNTYLVGFRELRTRLSLKTCPNDIILLWVPSLSSKQPQNQTAYRRHLKPGISYSSTKPGVVSG